jgi:hypothetical protein
MWTDIPTFREWENASADFRPRMTNKIWLKDIDNWVRKYHFAGRPIDSLRKLKKAIEDWYADPIRPEQEPKMALARIDLTMIVDKKWRDLTRHVPGYKRVSFVAYETHVFSQRELDKSKGSKDDATDIAARWQQMQKAANSAYLLMPSKVKDDKEVLKIFMAPEFYFRGKGGSYDLAKHFPTFLEQIPDFTKDARFRDWLFVLGTFVCSWATEEERNLGLLTTLFGVKRKVKTSATVENYCLVQKGGYVGRDHIHDVQVAKEFPSHIDFGQPEGQEWYDPSRKAKILGGTRKADSPPGSREFDPKFKTTFVGTPLEGDDRVKDIQGTYSGKFDSGSGEIKSSLPGVGATSEDESAAFGCVFTLDGITFGLEVCRDHYLARLIHANDVAGVKIHLVPSWGCSLQTGKGGDGGDSNHCVPSALAFNVDGARGDSQVVDETLKDWNNVLFSAALEQNKSYFPKQGRIKAYRPLDIPA